MYLNKKSTYLVAFLLVSSVASAALLFSGETKKEQDAIAAAVQENISIEESASLNNIPEYKHYVKTMEVLAQGSSQTLSTPAEAKETKPEDANEYSYKIIASNVNLRSDSSTEADIVTRLGENEKINIVSRSGDWTRVQTSLGDMGWVKNEFVATKDFKVVSIGQKIVNYSKKYLGVKYVWGGTSPKGFDCSGLMKYAYANYGITLNRVAADQAKQGKKVDRNSLKPGDLVFFDTDGGRNYISHVGMYVGGGNFIHASSGSRSGRRVIISSLNDRYYSNAYITARRIVE